MRPPQKIFVLGDQIIFRESGGIVELKHYRNPHNLDSMDFRQLADALIMVSDRLTLK